MEKNLTSGSVAKTLVLFSLPFLLSYFLQTLYGLADLFIIGRFCPTEATTAVSVGGQVMHMLTVMIVGLSMGSTVLIGRAVGSGDSQLKNKAVGNTAVIFLVLSLVLTLLLSLCIGPIVRVMSTPAEAVAGTSDYLFVCFLGIPFITAYNIISSVFRGMGDSKSPMYFVAVACVVNIVLDYVFIGFCGMGPMGAALGTTIAQAFSVIVAFAYMVRKKVMPGFSKEHFTPDRTVAGNIFKVGIPVAAQDGFIQISFIVITIFANMRGLNDSAAVGVVEKFIGILFLVPSSMLAAVSAICAQNVGAGEHERARKTLFYAIGISVGIGFIFAVTFQFLSGAAVGLFVSDSEVIRLGDQY
ncbi:MAG: MATE family efflux transporter, partial [Lachnospiraceae bacterium]|nr:MATE family efflux transporter [Lachnospiraceae bacterium]